MTAAPVSHKIQGHGRSDGFMLMGLLIVLALGGISLMAAVDIWTVQRQREKEQDLLFVGDAYREAIRRYYFAAPAGTPRTLPARVELLLEDDRYPIPVRHLRRAYPDPMTGNEEWGEVRIGDRLAGVYSLSEGLPLKQAGFPPAYKSFSERSSYRDWVFSFNGAARTSGEPVAVPDKKTDLPSISSQSSSFGIRK